MYGIQKGRASEFWDINVLIYCTEAKLKTLNSELTNPVYDIVSLYLSDGSDFIKKWYGKTHNLFLQAWLKHSSFVGKLVLTEGQLFPEVSLDAYRRRLHVTCCPKATKHPEEITYDKIRSDSKSRKNKRLALPDEDVITQVKKRVQKVIEYTLINRGN